MKRSFINPKQGIVWLALLCFPWVSEATDYYVHPAQGANTNTGTTPHQAFQSLARLAEISWQAGDRILLAAGQIFPGKIVLQNVKGTQQQPIQIDVYGGATGEKATIDAKNELAAIQLSNCRWIQVQNVRITANGYTTSTATGSMRVGILVEAQNMGQSEHIRIQDVTIDQVYFENAGFTRSPGEVRSANGTQRYGWGIRLMADAEAFIENVLIQRVNIQDVSHTGIKLTGAGRGQNISQIKVYDNTVIRSGGPGIQMSNAKFVHVQGNRVSHSGDNQDSRKWGRGSGLWTWSCAQILIERNQFLHANGPGDSAGAHIDYNCDHVVLQYNFSAYNAGGFCEILGNNFNCVYRYNISVNDGHRVKGQNGAFQEGKIFWLSGYQGEKKPRKGPVNSYFYNNTLYVKADQPSKIAIDNRAQGILIVNNVFHLEGPVSLVAGDQYLPDDLKGEGDLSRTVFKNNLFLRADTWPANAPIQPEDVRFGLMDFMKLGGTQPEDYQPKSGSAWQGIVVEALPGDKFKVMPELQPDVDFFGQPLMGLPPMGAALPRPTSKSSAKKP